MLASRALGAAKCYYCGARDEYLEKTIATVSKKFGGTFSAEHVRDWKKFLKEFDGIKVHLTMYGDPYEEKMQEIKKELESKDILLIVGSEKVETEIYNTSDYNIAVLNQPHSEVSAVALALNELRLKKDFSKAELFISPGEKTKNGYRKNIKAFTE